MAKLRVRLISINGGLFHNISFTQSFYINPRIPASLRGYIYMGVGLCENTINSGLIHDMTTGYDAFLAFFFVCFSQNTKEPLGSDGLPSLIKKKLKKKIYISRIL
jgi:hypothetical protein